MSFGPSSNEKSAIAGQQQISKTAQDLSKTEAGAGGGLLNTGGTNTAAGTNFFNTLLNGNQANTTALLQPDINRIRGAEQGTLQAASTLMPRGGGRSGALFSSPFAANSQIGNLFNGVRSGAAGNLAQIGLGQQGIGAGLFNTANNALNPAVTSGQNVFNDAFQNRQYSNSMWGQLGGGLFNLATTPFGGGAAANGLLGLIH